MYRILVVDDEPLVRTAIRSMIDWSQHGFVADLEARNGEQAMQLLRAYPDVAIILLDLVMPEMDGITLLHRMHSEGIRRRVIVLSAHDEFRLVREAFTAGAEDYLLKADMDAASLISRLQAAASRIREESDATVSVSRVVRQESRAAREEVFASLLRGSSVVDLTRRLEALRIERVGPFSLALLWPDGTESIRFRYRDAPHGFFRAALTNTVRQVVDRFGSGEVVGMSDDEIALVLLPESAARGESAATALLEEIASNARLYLDVELVLQAGRTVDTVDALADEYRRLQSYRTSASKIIVKARRLIAERYADPTLGLSDLARRLHVSRNYLSSEFRRETGKTLTDIIRETRVAAAKELLLTTDWKVYEISERCGYRNVEHFCRVFRKTTGRPPGSYGRRPQVSRLNP